jgi:hypothetical protein
MEGPAIPENRRRDDGPFGRDQGETAETAAGAVYAACFTAASACRVLQVMIAIRRCWNGLEM